ncbi:Cell wall-associated polypeptide CWBP200 [Streptococcus suis]|uniref:RHS repeat-associated core domain-containing protein n=7 Tax=Streptococcus suis TaxID=1307 RepID=UPI000697D0C5|nr:RHS repeat-associated core domain-containing protein [Streptococcus suis]CYU32954.1 Cell wall-associated polypeptide CWBP200 [Streptococcus suis]CYV06698.1 Cell wall-associated polypeptide CWBP200 [Streptococcus suis]
MVNPPSEDNLPGEDEVLYRSQVQDVLIPYTTKDDTYNYYETRNYVNDVNRDHTQVLQTYDDQLQKRETYVYGNGRATYTNESTGDSYHYLTSQSGSVTGLTQNGQAVASSSYALYGATKQTTDATGNPFAYNGEARDVTGLDYLRARYYDSQAGTFLTADSYPGSQTDPLSQNLYAYVQNNPANYTDPSGHIWKTLTNAYNTAKKAVSKAYNAAKKVVVDTYNTVKKAVVNTYNTIKSAVGHAVNWVGQKVNQAVNWAGNAVRQTTNWIGQQWNNFQTSAYQAGRSIYNSASQYVSHQYQQAKQTVSNAWEQAKAMGQSVYNWGVSKSREAMNIARSWTKSLEETFRHSCETASFANGGTTVYASEIDFTSVKNTAQDLRLQSEIEDAKNSKLSDIEKSDLIVKAYEDYLYNKNKEAFDEYWSARKGYKQWKPENGNYADTVERRLGRKLQNSGINMKELMQEMGDEILSANSNASYIPFVAGSKVSASIQDNYQFYNLVNTGQPLDLKSRAYQSDGDTGYSIWSRDWGDGVKDDYAGNYLYGYVGKGYLNSSDTYLKISAGAAQEMSDIKKMGLFAADWKAFKSFITGNYFDNSGDSKMIQDGIDDYKLKGGSE